jgi:hypothetical protein
VGYFAPPSHETWRLADTASTAQSFTVDWLPPGTLATTWNVAVRSIIAKPVRDGAPDVTDAIAVGLIPPLADGELVIDAKAVFGDNWIFACRTLASHACPDCTVVLRIRIADGLLAGLACRVRPPCSVDDTRDLVAWLGTIEERFEEPVVAAVDPSRSAEHRPRVDPALVELDDAQQHDDHERAAAALAVLAPFLLQAPLSRFALNLHLAEGWVQKRRAFEGDAEAATRAIDIFRAVMASIEGGRHRDLLRLASLWLGQAYSRRDQPGDLRCAILAYERVLTLDEPGASRSADVHFRAGVLHRAMAERLRQTPAAAAEQVRRAMEQFEATDRICERLGAANGRIETAVARGDTLRLAGDDSERDRAAEFYGQAFRWLTEPGGQTAVGAARFNDLLRHLFVCMRALDALQFDGARTMESGQTRALGIFLRPLTLTRKLAVRGLSLEMALGRALGPEVSLFYVGGGLHPGAADMGSAVSARADWRLPVQIELRERDLVVLVPGDTPGMQWELRFLHDEGLLHRTLLVMLPAALHPDAASLWEGSAAAAVEFGLALPHYAAAGGFFRLTTDGDVVRRVPFEAIQEPEGLRAVIADLLRSTDEILARKARWRERIDAGEAAGHITRIRVD